MREDEISKRSLLLGIGVCAGLLLLCGGVAVYVKQHHDSVRISPEVAAAEIQQIRTRFAGQKPLVDMDAHDAAFEPTGGASPAPIRSFHTVIFDTRGGPRLVKLTAPPCFARLFAHRDGRFRWLGELTFLDDTEFDPEPIQLSFDDIRRRGPGLLVDYRHASGGQFIAWVE